MCFPTESAADSKGLLKRESSISFASLVACGLYLFISETGLGQGKNLEDLFLKGDYQECLAEAEKMLAGGFSPQPAILELEVLLETGKYREANRKAGVFQRTGWRDAQLVLAVTRVFLTNGDAVAAHRIVDRFFSNMPEPPWGLGSASVVAYAELNILAGSDGRMVLSELLEPAKEADPNAREVYLSIGQLALAHHDMELASENFRAGLKLFPGDSELLLGMEMAGIPLPETELDEAKGIAGYVDLALEANPNFTEALFYKAEQLAGMKDFDASEKLLARLFEVNDSHPEGHGLAAAISLLQEDVEAAEKSIAKARKFWPENPAVWSTIGRTLAGHYRFAEALVYLKKAAAAAPDSAAANFDLGANQLRFAEQESGWKNVERALELDPYHVAAFNLMALRDKIAGYPVMEEDGVKLRMSPEDMAVFGRRAMDRAVAAKQSLEAKYRTTLSQEVMVEMLPSQEDFAIRTFGLPGGESFLGVCFGPLITMTSPRGRMGRANWEAVLWHEMAHTVTLSMSGHRIPRWLSEGISVYEERQAKEGWGQGMNSSFRSRILTGSQIPITSMNSLFAGPDILLGYYLSSLVVEHIEKRFGIEALRRILIDLAAGISIEKSLENHTLPLPELNASYLEYARAQAESYGPDLDWKPISDAEYKEYRTDPEKWVSSHPDRYATTMMLAAEYLKEGKWEEAKTLAGKMIKEVPDNREDFSPYQVLADASRGLGDHAGERSALLKLYSLDANQSEAAASLLKIEGSGRIDAERLLETNPFQEQAYRTLAKSAASRQDYESLLALDPRDATRLHYELAVILRDSDPEAARRHVLQALEDNPRFKLALDLLLTLKSSP